MNTGSLRWVRWSLVGALLSSPGPEAIAAVAQDPPPTPAPAGFCHSRILVKPKAGVAVDDLAALDARLGTKVLRAFPDIGNLQILQVPEIKF